MNEMVESGIDWIGVIPKEWKLKRIKFALKNRVEKNNPIISKDILSLTAKQGVIPLGEKEGGGNKPKEDLSAYHLAYPGDIVLNSMNILSGSVGLSKYFGCVSPVYYMLRPFNDNEDVRFYNYIFQTEVFQKSLFGLGNGILIKESDSGKFNTIRMRIPMDKFGRLFIPVASPQKQKQISDFLDQKCNDIDVLMDSIQKQIDRLCDYKKTVITDCVTKGIKPHKRLISSNIEWIGDYPYDWKLIRIKNASTIKGRIGWQGLRSDEFVEDSTLPYLITGTDFLNGYVNWDTCVHISEKRYQQDSSIHIKENDLLITKDGTIGKVAVAKKCPRKVSLNSGVFIIRNNKDYIYDDRYMYYILQSSQFDRWYELTNSGNSTIRHLNQEKFYNFKFTYPDIEEQIQIAKFLDEKCTYIDGCINDFYKQLQILNEYKKALIYEYITGKKELING